MTDRINIAELVAGRVAALAEYAPEPLSAVAERLGVPEDRLIKLDANENPYGPVEAARKAISDYPHYHRYPDALSQELRSALAAYLGLDAGQILVGNGSDELIDLLLKALRPGPGREGIGEVVVCPPTFGMYQFYGACNDMRVVEIPRRVDFTLDLEAIEDLVQADARPRVLFLASPNNPDGGPLTDKDLARLLDLPFLLVLDEAYVEFGGCSRVGMVDRHDNLVVLRTFSKWAGLAGLRLGYGVFPASLMNTLLRLKSPYNVNVAGQVAALATLRHVREAERAVAAIISERKRMAASLAALSWLRVYPSEANFILVDVAGVGINRLREEMEAEGIILRYYEGPLLGSCVRITIGTPPQNDAVLDVLRGLGSKE